MANIRETLAKGLEAMTSGNTTDSLKAEVGRLRSKKIALQQQLQATIAAHDAATSRRREALLGLGDKDHEEASRELMASDGKTRSIGEAIAVLDDAIEEAELKLTAAYERESRVRQSREKLALIDSLTNARREFMTTVPTYMKVLRSVPGTLNEAAGVAELFDQFLFVENNAIRPLIEELKRDARMLADESISAQMLRASGIWPASPIEPLEPLAPTPERRAVMGSRDNVAHAAFGVGGTIDDGNPLTVGRS